jgi:hypothetical protein
LVTIKMDWIMRKYILIVAVAVASFFAYSCNSGTIDREEVPVPTVRLVPLVLNSGVSVKTSLDADGSSVNWTSGDHIAVIDNVEYSAVRDFDAESVNGTSATFVGSVAEGTEQFYAVYPLDCVTGANESSISVTLPSAQNPASGTFAEELNISVASGSKSPGVEDVNNVYKDLECYTDILNELYYYVQNKCLPPYSSCPKEIIKNQEAKNLQEWERYLLWIDYKESSL